MSTNNKSAAYDIYLPIWDKAEPWFCFPEGQRQRFVGNAPWRVSTLNKKERIHAQASSCCAVVNIYPDAIEVGGPAGSSDKVFGGILGAVVSLVGFFLSVMMLVGLPFSLFSSPALLMLVTSFYGASFFLRLSFFTVRDMPVLFNRQSKTVSLSKPRHLSFMKFWQPGIIEEVVTYPWEFVHARSYKYIQMMGETSRESYNLTLLCAESDSPRSFRDFTYIGHVETWEDATLWRLWEHIRRYMEEDGPPLQPGETLRTSGLGKLPKFPQHLIDAAGGEALSIEEIEKLTSAVDGPG